jgi:hypothetical protein
MAGAQLEPSLHSMCSIYQVAGARWHAPGLAQEV